MGDKSTNQSENCSQIQQKAQKSMRLEINPTTYPGLNVQLQKNFLNHVENISKRLNKTHCQFILMMM